VNEFPHFTVSTMRVQRYDGTTRCLIDVCEYIRWGGHETVSEQRKEQYSRLPSSERQESPDSHVEVFRILLLSLRTHLETNVWWTTTRSTSLVFNEGVCVDNKKEGRSEKKKQNLNRYVVSHTQRYKRDTRKDYCSEKGFNKRCEVTTSLCRTVYLS
jgi:hypothetical protein